jgi:uncharacterized protein YodC (DUF2158 family)
MSFQPGDVVSLKSGGPFMTVSAVADDGVECVWLGEEGELFREMLPLAVLRTADDDQAVDDEYEPEADAEGEENAEADEALRRVAS